MPLLETVGCLEGRASSPGVKAKFRRLMSEGSESLDSFGLTRRPSPLVAGGCLSPLGRNILGSAQYALHHSYRHSYPGPGCYRRLTNARLATIRMAEDSGARGCLLLERWPAGTKHRCP